MSQQQSAHIASCDAFFANISFAASSQRLDSRILARARAAVVGRHREGQTPMELMKTMELKIVSLTRRMHAIRLSSIVALVLSVTGATASAETLMMPNRDMLMGASEVVWGITTLPDGAATTYTMNFGDGVITAPAAVTDRSYIALNHTYAASGVYIATLTVMNGPTTQTATVTVNVYNSALLSPFVLRQLNVNRAIQDGLRYLWFSQSNRTTFDTNNETAWAIL